MKEKISIFKAEQTKSANIDLFDTPVMAGFPSPAEDYVEKKLDLNEYLITHPAATFFVRVEGDSMKDANIFKGDIIIIDRSIHPKNGSIIIAAINGEFTLKRLLIKDKKIFLQPENNSFPTIEIKSTWDFEVWGVVTYVIHKAK